MERHKPNNPFYGRNPDEVWKELLSKAVPVDTAVAMKQIEEIIKERKAQKKPFIKPISKETM